MRESKTKTIKTNKHKHIDIIIREGSHKKNELIIKIYIWKNEQIQMKINNKLVYCENHSYNLDYNNNSNLILAF